MGRKACSPHGSGCGPHPASKAMVYHPRYNRGEPRKHEAAGEKPDTGGHALSDLTYVNCPEEQIHRDRKQGGEDQELVGVSDKR